ncbi:signal recognition particle-docking protein FtsY [Phormidesmis priestleyi ULC007]|uniref:Signal recognition particle receptor FtsY n=1 Tax=Phormidesmis priestleyi ULC007 TaxID=1920490 RepID=A0A2T1DJF1_9CYAN|nr:signal recognition particle-docking protein FtsY [Phormidesmis priestleyi]PSB20617.1 signal recognition particle-docking protein FtsY [Phormidesmis priestleyi ULC007]PZO54287.1 MAG: signal recognition particle-docking protein FtsY [Phormidesmis priestleyi]
MTFNWFNRKFDQKAEESKADEPAQPEPEPTPAATSNPSDVDESYLSFAKAAYENIKKKRQQQEELVQPVEAIAPQEILADTVEAPEDAVPVSPEGFSVEAVNQFLGTLEDVKNDLTAAIASPESLEPAPEVAAIPAEAPPEPAAPLPFWAQSEADREARLERLRATAIEEEQPLAAVQPPSAIEEAPAFALDEGFLWSTEVLAAQGRRAEDITLEEITWLKRLRQGLDKTRRGLINQLKAIVGQGPLNQDAVTEIEALLLQADAGVEATDKIIAALQTKLREEVLPPEEAIAYLKKLLRDLLDRPLQSHNPVFVPEKDTLNIWLITGVNGAGKTTTIGKLAHIAQKSGYRCLIAAADTFRAAAVEQVKVWGQRSGVDVIANPGQNTDPAAVVFDGIAAAQSRGTELLLVDTAGRLQNKKNLMDELTKIRRIIDKKAGNARVESLLVLDATLGQNGLRQARVFSEAAQLSGVVLTKLDGTAKGGVALAVVEELGLPIRFIGAGEGIEDLRPFSSYEFVEALISG